MILLLGGTAETATLALALAEAGHAVLVSTATDVPLSTGVHPRIRRRSGPLDAAALATLVRAEGIRVLVDAAHPYAERVHATADAVARELGLPCVVYARPPALRDGDSVLRAADHAEGAAKAFAVAKGRPLLLTIGSRNLSPYIAAASPSNTPVYARVLDHPDSLDACRRAGLAPYNVIAGRGPFSQSENRELLTRLGIGVLVTKDGGEAGGLRAKLDAAREVGAAVVLVERPATAPGRDAAVQTVAELLRGVSEAINRSTRDREQSG